MVVELAIISMNVRRWINSKIVNIGRRTIYRSNSYASSLKQSIVQMPSFQRSHVVSFSLIIEIYIQNESNNSYKAANSDPGDTSFPRNNKDLGIKQHTQQSQFANISMPIAAPPSVQLRDNRTGTTQCWEELSCNLDTFNPLDNQLTVETSSTGHRQKSTRRNQSSQKWSQRRAIAATTWRKYWCYKWW